MGGGCTQDRNSSRSKHTLVSRLGILSRDDMMNL